MRTIIRLRRHGCRKAKGLSLRRFCLASAAGCAPLQKHIRQRDLLGLVDQIVSLLVTGNTNDRQLKALFNYVLQTGDAQRFRAFIGEIAERAPQEKEKLMTIADRLREEGAMQGKHEEALRIAQEMLDRGLDRELVMMVTRLSPDDLIAQSH